MSFVINFGKWGGFYIHRGSSFRICLGWVALTIVRGDIDLVLSDLTEQNERLKKLMESGFKVEELEYRHGSLDVRMKHHENVVRLFASQWVEWFKDFGGENYVSVTVYHEQLGPFEITMRRLWGKSPAQVAGELRAKCALLDEALFEVYLHGNFRWLTEKMRTPVKEAAADAVEAHSVDGISVERWWRSANG